MSKFETGSIAVQFDCEWGVFQEGSDSSLCYATSKERAEWIAGRLNTLAELENKTKGTEMIESKRIDSPTQETPEYPKLMIHKSGEFIVLFTDYSQGVVVESNGGDSYAVGHQTGLWAQQEFKPYDGVVLLRNR